MKVPEGIRTQAFQGHGLSVPEKQHWTLSTAGEYFYLYRETYIKRISPSTVLLRTAYLHMRKLHLAKSYFYFTEDNIAEVAFCLSYNESSYYSKVLKSLKI